MSVSMIKSSLRILITAGPTHEYIDPVRFISNPSSGLMGLCIAREALKHGFHVCLVLGPCVLDIPRSIELVKVISAKDMFREVKSRMNDYDVLVMSAAVSDFSVSQVARRKISKEAFQGHLVLSPNPDILEWAGHHKKDQLLIGFAAQTHAVIRKGREKLIKKNSDLMVANYVGKKDCGFSSKYIFAAILDKHACIMTLQKITKNNLAKRIMNEIKKRKSDERVASK